MFKLTTYLFVVVAIIQVSIFSRATAQIVSPPEDELVPDSGSPLIDFDVTIDALKTSMAGCPLSKEKREVLQAYIAQLLSSDFQTCTHADYATNSQIRSYILHMANTAAIEHAEACRPTAKFVKSVYDAMDGQVTKPIGPCSSNVVTCNVRASGNLNFRSFPHVANQPKTAGNELTKKGQVLDRTQVLVDKDYRGWSYVAATNTRDGTLTAGWVSNRHLVQCR